MKELRFIDANGLIEALREAQDNGVILSFDYVLDLIGAQKTVFICSPADDEE